MANVFRADHIGTFIKPQALQTAQENSAASADAAAARHAAEEAAILEALQMQSAVLLTFRTDGQLRRANFDEPYITAISGLRRSQAPVRSASLRSPWEVYSTLKQTSRVTESEVSFLKTKARSPFKVCLSSPSALALRFYRPGVTDAVYRTVADLAAAFGEILQSEVNALFQDGVEYVQLSSLAYHALFEGGGASVFDLPVNDAAALFDALVAID